MMTQVDARLELGNVPGAVVVLLLLLLLLLLCIVGIWASGKLVDTLSLIVAVCVGIYLMLAAAASTEDAAVFLAAMRSIPFFRQFLCLFGSAGIVASVTAEFDSFARELLLLLLLCMLISAALELAKPLETACGEIPAKWLKFLLIWTLRLLACALGEYLFLLLVRYVLSAIPQALLAGICCAVFLTLLVMVFSPVAEFLVLSAKVVPTKFLTTLSKFVSTNKMGGKLQVSFYATFVFVLVLMFVQASGVFSAELDALRVIIETRN